MSDVACKCVGQLEVEPESAEDTFKLQFEFHYNNEQGETERVFLVVPVGAKKKPHVGMEYTIDTETKLIS